MKLFYEGVNMVIDPIYNYHAKNDWLLKHAFDSKI